MSWELLDETLQRLVHKKALRQAYPPKLAMFDLDHTLITTRSGYIHPTNSNDWQWFPGALEALQQLGADYCLVVISNQAAANEQTFERVEFVFNELLERCLQFTYVEFYIALAKNVYRKPATTIFEKYIWPHFEPSRPPLDIFYVGDAAGRQNDFADTDRKFAYNLHLLLHHLIPFGGPVVAFYTPEEYYTDSLEAPRKWQGFDPHAYYKESKQKDALIISTILEHQGPLLVILIGPPASGKSTLARQLINTTSTHSITYINQDTCRSKTAAINLLNLAKNSTEKPSLIIVDNTNPAANTRLDFIHRTRKNIPDIYVIYLHMNESQELYQHLNFYREKLEFHRTGQSTRVPEIAYKVYYKKYEEPAPSESVDQIINIPFIPVFHSRYEIVMFLQRT